MENPQKIVLSGCFIINEKREILLLYRRDNQYYETPGGKVRLDQCEDQENPSLDELKDTAKKGLYEKLGEDVRFGELEFFNKVEFMLSDGRKAVAHKFITQILEGKPVVNEPNVFERFDWINVTELEGRPLSPDLILLSKKIKDFVQNLTQPSL